METIEISASNKDEALNKASEALGVAADQIKITVIEETKGLFGKPGKVRVKAEVIASKASKAKKTKVEEPVAEAPAPEPEKPAKAAKAEKAEKPKKAAKSEKAEEPAAAPATPAAEVREEVVASEADAEAMKGILDKLLDLADMEAEVKVTNLNGRYINMQIDGADVGYLVGRRGEVLNALQYLCN
ncbi:MAG: KH domain-containing protein, partial [Armatimonadota bacterium]